MQKKIAIYSGSVPSSTFIDRLIEGLASNGNKIYIFGHKEKKCAYHKNVYLETYSNRYNKFYILIKYSILLFLYRNKEKKKLDTILKNEKKKSFLKVKYYPVLYHKPDIFHLQWAKGVKEWSWVQEFGIKLILSLRGTHITVSPIANSNLEQEYRKYFPRIDGFHAVSQSMLKESLKYGVNQAKAKVIYSGLDLKKLEFDSTKSNNNKCKIVSIGRSHWVKGYNYALDACAILKAQKFDFQYTIIGIENDEELVFQKEQLALSEYIFFKNKLPNQAIIKEIQHTNILLLPSIQEGIANVVLEAMAIGTIVLSTNCGGMNEVITDSKNGFLVPIRDSNAMAEKIKYISSLSQNEIEMIAQNARNTIENQHDFKKVVKQMEELYQTV